MVIFSLIILVCFIICLDNEEAVKDNFKNVKE